MVKKFIVSISEDALKKLRIKMEEAEAIDAEESNDEVIR